MAAQRCCPHVGSLRGTTSVACSQCHPKAEDKQRRRSKEAADPIWRVQSPWWWGLGLSGAVGCWLLGLVEWPLFSPQEASLEQPRCHTLLHAMRLTGSPRLLLAVATVQPRLLLLAGDGSGAYDVGHQSDVSA